MLFAASMAVVLEQSILHEERGDHHSCTKVCCCLFPDCVGRYRTCPCDKQIQTTLLWGSFFSIFYMHVDATCVL